MKSEMITKTDGLMTSQSNVRDTAVIHCQFKVVASASSYVDCSGNNRRVIEPIGMDEREYVVILSEN